MAHVLLDDAPGLILSSEWDFSPFTFPIISEDLSNFVFVGLPASEAGNALILPLAGHELGHSIWRRAGVQKSAILFVSKAVHDRFFADEAERLKVFGYSQRLEDPLEDPLVFETYRWAFVAAARQCEETFCDAIGVRLFGDSFIDSFEYLLIPSLGGDRSESYPPLTRRLKNMSKAAELFGYQLREEHTPPVLETDRLLPDLERFALQVADDAAESVTLKILQSAGHYCAEKCVPLVDVTIARNIAQGFLRYVPARDPKYLGNIIYAGWLVYKDFSNFALEIDDRDRAFDILNSLVFKSVEVLELSE